MNSVHTNFCARPSTVAKAIFEKGGNDFRNKLVQKTSGRIEYGDIAVTEGCGNLRCKAVYHACFEKTPTSQEEVICTHHIRNQSFFSLCPTSLVQTICSIPRGSIRLVLYRESVYGLKVCSNFEPSV